MAYTAATPAAEIYSASLKTLVDQLPPDMQARVAKVLIAEVRNTPQGAGILGRVQGQSQGLGDLGLTPPRFPGSGFGFGSSGAVARPHIPPFSLGVKRYTPAEVEERRRRVASLEAQVSSLTKQIAGVKGFFSGRKASLVSQRNAAQAALNAARADLAQAQANAVTVIPRINGLGEGWGDIIGQIGAAAINVTGGLLIAKETQKFQDKEASRQADLIKQQAAAQVEAAKAMAAAQVQQSAISAKTMRPVYITAAIGGVVLLGGLFFLLRRKKAASPAK